MLLVHKQPPQSLLPSISFAHRRNPSAPSFISVLPTRTPGLLSLSKPRDVKSQRTLAQLSKSPRPVRIQKPAVVVDDVRAIPAPKDSTEGSVATAIREESTVAAPAEKPRGRNTKEPGSKKPLRRSVSQAAPKSSQPSQAEASNVSDTESKNRKRQPPPRTAPPTPNASTVLGPPSGKLARNRRARHKSSPSINFTFQPPATEPVTPPATPLPTPSAAIPIPTRRMATPQPISRSAPLSSTPLADGRPVKVHAFSDWDQPASLKAAETDGEGRSTWQQLALMTSSGPRTAPLGKTPSFPSFPSLSPPPSPTTTRMQKHQRSPSFPIDTMFSMSLGDEEDQTGGRIPSPLRLRNRKSFNARQILYAGSSFQNAPQASDLPAPRFSATP